MRYVVEVKQLKRILVIGVAVIATLIPTQSFAMGGFALSVNVGVRVGGGAPCPMPCNLPCHAGMARGVAGIDPISPLAMGGHAMGGGFSASGHATVRCGHKQRCGSRCSVKVRCRKRCRKFSMGCGSKRGCGGGVRVNVRVRAFGGRGCKRGC